MPKHSLMDSIESTTSHVTRMIMFNNIKTGDPIIDAFFMTFLLGCFNWLITWIYDNGIDKQLRNLTIDNAVNWFYRKQSIIIEGKRCSSTSSYNGGTMYITSVYSDRFKALWNHIIESIESNPSIYKIKENHSNHQSSVQGRHGDKYKNFDMFMVYQNKHFKIDDHIYVQADVEIENDSNEKDKTNIKTDKITITIYSYKYSLSYLKKYIDNITSQYLSSIKETRENKRFIYFLDKVESNQEDDDNKLSCWREDLFESSRTFHNIFFDGKKQLIEKIDFFLKNKEWYYEKGIPYSLGIGLHGPPGTGKTSFIKALANYTKRHVIVISLKLIKTKQQLEHFFFENTYNDYNENNSITWDKKILVFEDIDCIGDIILNRENKLNHKKNTSRKNKSDKNADVSNESKAGDMKIGDLLQAVCELNDTGTTAGASSLSKENPITLDDILNLWDGIRETPGRILVISSNHYDKLDPALIRPGRIDITHELSNASHSVISDIYIHLFGNPIDKTVLSNIKEHFYSPAELINIYVGNKTEDQFLERLLQNKKV